MCARSGETAGLWRDLHPVEARDARTTVGTKKSGRAKLADARPRFIKHKVACGLHDGYEKHGPPSRASMTQAMRLELHFLRLAFLGLGLAAATTACSSETLDVPLYPIPFKASDGTLQVFNGTSFQPLFIKGMNMGVALPGTQAGEITPTAEDYDRWFAMMSEMGINSIRLYTLHFPRFYQRLYDHNVRHPQKPIYVFHGIWLDEENPTKNLNDMQSSYDDNIAETIECVHGQRYVFERKGRAHGEYDTDISPWVIGWLVGREVFPDEVRATNQIPGARARYDGAYVSLPSGSETSVWWAERVDKIAAYEASRYRIFRPISVSSWPTLDALHHPTEGTGADEDKEQLDLARLDTRNHPAGYFASYHAYPYYPDWMNEDPNYVTARDSEGPNSYAGYLQTLRAYYFPKPLLVAEVGVPSSWGNAHFSQSGMNHGGQDEVQQGHDDVRLFHNAYDTETAGAILFAWIDEWWKRTWIVDELALPRERYKLWHNVTSPEQNFGLVAFEVVAPTFTQFVPVKGEGRIREIRADADAEYFHVKLTLNAALTAKESITVGYDTYADELGESVLPDGKKTSQRSEFALRITPTSADLMVTEPYDQFGVWHDTQAAWHDKAISELPSGRAYRSLRSDGGPWNPVRWKNNSDHGSDDGVYRFPGTLQEIGKLGVRKVTEVERGHSAVVFDDTTISIRIPWTLLQVSDPSDLRVIDDNPKTRERETSPTEGFRIAVSLGADLLETPRLKWPRWDSAPFYIERRKSSYEVFASGLRTIPDHR